MIYPVDKLIAEQKLLSAFEDETLRDALAKMVSHDYSQLPVVDEQGNLTGLITEQTISRSYFHLGDKVGVLDLKVANCYEKAVTLPLASDVLEAFEKLGRDSAVVIVEDKRPVGILTNADAVSFFRGLSEGLVLIEDVEMTLRQYIDEAFPTDKEREQARHNAFKHLLKGEGSSMPTYDLMTFGDYVNLIANASNWQRFEHQLESKVLFRTYMDQVRDIRNQLTHFRGQLDRVQYDVLTRARNWLAGRRRRVVVQLQTVVAETKAIYFTGSSQGKYGPLQDWLKSEGMRNPAERAIALTFSQIEEIINEELPASAREHRSWWANDLTVGQQSSAWLGAGWAIADVDFSAEIITFRQTDSVLYQVFWADLIKRLREQRPGLTRMNKTFSQNWCHFSAGRTGCNFGWAFTKDGNLRTELYIDTGDKKKNKEYYDDLYAQKENIEREFGEPLHWDQRADRQTVRIFTTYPATIKDTPAKLEEAKEWALRSVQRLAEVFQKRIKDI
jgi:hypothetical protein